MTEINEPTEEEKRVANINKEMEKWRVLGIDPKDWMPKEGVLGLSVRFEVLNDILVEAGLVDMEDASRRMQEKSLERLRAIREELEPLIQQAKLDQIRNGNLRRRN